MTFLHKLMAEDSMAVKSSREISLPHNIRSECLLLFCLIINADDEILLLGCHSHAYWPVVVLVGYETVAWR